MENTVNAKLDELKEITEKLQDKALGIEEAVELFEKGVNISREIEKKLKDTELKISMLEGADNE